MKTVLENWIRQRTNTSTRQELDAWQLERLKQMINYSCAHGSFYRRLYQQVSLDDIQSLEDIGRLPLISAAHIKEDPLSLLCVGQGEISRIVTLKSSGTTGSPKRIFFTEADQQYTVDFFAEGMTDIVTPADKVAILMPCSRPGSIGDLLAKGLRLKGIKSLLAGTVVDISQMCRRLYEEECTAIVGIPHQVLAVGKYMEAYRINKRPRITSILLSADALAPGVKKAIEAIFECPVYNHFGMTETGFGGAVECKSRCGCHIREGDLLFEVIDPLSGEKLGEGPENTGEIVLSTLRRHAMPLLRYRTGDIGYIQGDVCTCGSYIKRLVPVYGRLCNLIDLVNNEKVPLLWHLDNALASWDNVADWRCVVKENTISIRLLCVKAPDMAGITNRLGQNVELGLFFDKEGYSLDVSYEMLAGFDPGGMLKRGLEMGEHK